jgi:hypothetical protein
MGPGAKVIGLPVVKNVPKVVPPIVGWTVEVAGGLNVMVPVVGEGKVKESPPKAPKKPVMESACATAALLMARAKSIKRRFIIGASPGWKNLACWTVLLEYKQFQNHLMG